MSNMFSSLTANARSKKMMIVIAATAALLVVALLSLAIVSIVNAVRAKTPTEDEPAPSTNGVPAGYVTTTFAENQLYKGNLILVNDTYAYSTEANTDVETISVEQGRAKLEGASLYSSNALQTLVQKEALDALNNMLLAFYEETGDDNVWVNLGTAGTATGIYAAGNTFELRYTTGVSGAPRPTITESDTYDWIFTNAYKYGFVQYYATADQKDADNETETETESQEHIFRYVGTVHAQIMKDKKINGFEAYLTYLRDSTSASKNVPATVDKKAYKVYYIAKDAQQVVPEKYKDSCVVSGDNMSGYIVTYCTTATTTK